MTEKTHIIWSARQSAWLGTIGPKTTNIKDAKRYTHAEALDICRRHRQALNDTFDAIPVNVADMAEWLED